MPGRSLSAKAGLSRGPPRALAPDDGERIIEPYFDDPFPACLGVAKRKRVFATWGVCPQLVPNGGKLPSAERRGPPWPSPSPLPATI